MISGFNDSFSIMGIILWILKLIRKGTFLIISIKKKSVDYYGNPDISRKKVMKTEDRTEGIVSVERTLT